MSVAWRGLSARSRPGRTCAARSRSPGGPRRCSRRSASPSRPGSSSPWHLHSPGIELRLEDGVEHIDVPPMNSHRLELDNVCDAIRGVAPLLLGRVDAVGQARTVDALYRSAEAGASVPMAT